MDKNVIIEIVGIAAGICTAASLVPQLIKMIKKKQADDVSLLMLIVLLCGLLLWIIYGVMRKDIPVIATNSFSFAANIALIFFRNKYKKK